MKFIIFEIISVLFVIVIMLCALIPTIRFIKENRVKRKEDALGGIDGWKDVVNLDGVYILLAVVGVE